MHVRSESDCSFDIFSVARAPPTAVEDLRGVGQVLCGAHCKASLGKRWTASASSVGGVRIKSLSSRAATLPGAWQCWVGARTDWPGVGIMEANDRQVTTVFTVQPDIPPSAFDKPSIMERYHRRRTTRWGVTARSPTMVTFQDTGFVECRWWNDGWTVKTVVTWRWSASTIPALDVGKCDRKIARLAWCFSVSQAARAIDPRRSVPQIQYRLVGLVVKASVSRAEDSGFESRLRRDFFRVESCQWLKNWLPC